MEKLFLLSGENLKLAKAEVLALTKAKRCFVDEKIMIIETNKKDFSRLAFTHKVYDLLFVTNKSNILKDFERCEWDKIYKESFSVRIKNFSKNTVDIDIINLKEKDLAGFIWRRVKKPKVDLVNAKTKIEIIITNKNIYCCKLSQKIKKDFEQRKAHLRPGFSVGSLHPKLARCLVNLTGIEKGIIVDHCCGSGGVLIEAGLMGFKVTGYDVSDNALSKCEKNLKFFKIRNYKLIKKDALKIKKKHSYIVTDLPYGIGVKLEKDFYESFLKNLRKILKKRAVIVFPDKINYKDLIKKSKLRLEQDFSYYIHKSLTKKVAIVS